MSLHISPLSSLRLPETGAVLGADIGWAKKAKTTSVCSISWTQENVKIEFSKNQLFALGNRDHAESVAAEAKALLRNQKPHKIAIDGMITPDLSQAPSVFREAERVLTCGVFGQIGKPGQASTENGQNLALQAALLAKAVCLTFGLPEQTDLIDGPVVEAFPNAFLASLLNDSQRAIIFDCMEENKARKKPKRLKKSDMYFKLLTASEESNGLQKLIGRLLPNRECDFAWTNCKNHDKRASLVCALTALSVASGQFTYVGDIGAGVIILPPMENADVGITAWAKASIDGASK